MTLTLLAGCLGGARPAEPAPAGASATPATLDVSPGGAGGPAGSIEGVVTDAELQPVPDAEVALLDLDVSVRTTDGGEFRFTSVPAGRHDLSVAKAGWASQIRRVDVKADASTRVQFELTRLAGGAGWVESFPHTLLHHAGEAFLDITVGPFAPNQTCENCEWSLDTEGPIQALLLEVHGAHSVPNPAKKAGEFLYLYDRSSSPTEIIWSGQFELPVAAAVNETVLGNLTQFRVKAVCDVYWACYEERRDVWVSAFHEMGIPDGFTMFEPE